MNIFIISIMLTLSMAMTPEQEAKSFVEELRGLTGCQKIAKIDKFFQPKVDVYSKLLTRIADLEGTVSGKMKARMDNLEKLRAYYTKTKRIREPVKLTQELKKYRSILSEMDMISEECSELLDGIAELARGFGSCPEKNVRDYCDKKLEKYNHLTRRVVGHLKSKSSISPKIKNLLKNYLGSVNKAMVELNNLFNTDVLLDEATQHSWMGKLEQSLQLYVQVAHCMSKKLVDAITDVNDLIEVLNDIPEPKFFFQAWGASQIKVINGQQCNKGFFNKLTKAFDDAVSTFKTKYLRRCHRITKYSEMVVETEFEETEVKTFFALLEETGLY